MDFFELSPAELTSLSVLIANSAAEVFNATQLNILGEFLSATGDLIGLIASRIESEKSGDD